MEPDQNTKTATAPPPAAPSPPSSPIPPAPVPPAAPVSTPTSGKSSSMRWLLITLAVVALGALAAYLFL